MRRLALFIERSIVEGTQWAAFEPNGEPLWNRVRLSVEDFMPEVLHQDAFQGARARGRPFVRCDRTTMTQDDIDNGRLVILIAVAPIVTAEFITVRVA